VRNFEPRIGFAWDPLGSGKTAIRGGFGFYDVLPLPYEFVILSSASAPYAANVSIGGPNLPANTFPNEAYNLAIANYSQGSLAGQRVSYIDPNPKRSYVLEWNLNVQQEISKNVTATVGYVGSRGIHLPFRTDDMNIVLPTQTAAGYVWPSPVGSGTVLNPSVGQLDRLVFGADSYYDALQAGAKINLSKRLLVQSSFTWGKSIDTGSSTIAGDQFSNSPSSVPFFFDAKLRRAVSDFNLGKNFVLSGVWEVPGSQSLHGVEGWALNGWQVGAIIEASSGAPFTVVLAGDQLGLNNGDPWAYPDRVISPGCNSLVNAGNPNNYIKTQCFKDPTLGPNAQLRLGNNGRNALTGPGLFNTDFAFTKNNRVPWLREGSNLQFRAELFNIFNRANFAPPLDHNVLLYNPDGTVATGQAVGQIDRTLTSSRQVQFGLKLTF
jgi:hypothetical protein